MRYISKGREPAFLIMYKKKHLAADYDDEGFRKYVPELRTALVREQAGMCAYCCRKISADNENSHIEHIEPRHHKGKSAGRGTLDYNNIVASCNSENTCGIHKRNEYDAVRFISPLSEECEDKIRYIPLTGEVETTEENKYTVDLLNLNEYKLISTRKNIGRQIEALLQVVSKEDFIRDYRDAFVKESGFADFIDQYIS